MTIRYRTLRSMVVPLLIVGLTIVPAIAHAACTFTVTSSTFPPGPGPQVGQRFTVNPCQVRTSGIQATGQATVVQILLQLGAIPSAPNQAKVSINPTGVVSLNDIAVGARTGSVTLQALLPN